MNFYILLIVSFVCFIALTLLRKWKDVPVLIAIAIGAACNANLWTSLNMPVNMWGMTFGFGSVLYVLFVFTIFLRIKDYSVKDGKIMALTSIAAIMISALFEVSARLIYEGQFSIEHLYTFCGYAFSSLGTFVGVWLMCDIYEVLEKHNVNPYLEIILTVGACSIMNSLFYYGGIALVRWMRIDNFLSILLGSIIIKLFSINLGMLSYLINHTIWVPKEIEKLVKNEK